MFAALLILSPCCLSGDSGELDRVCYCNSVTDTKMTAAESCPGDTETDTVADNY
ncbi:hypothetical protein HBI82_148680 [Parastagonospora nodorum]|nr:hypothetical protein HBI82_148680 [Parastagonospora nodorum]